MTLVPDTFSCFIRGIPAPQGSKTPDKRKDGSVYVRDANPNLKDWRYGVHFVLQSKGKGPPWEGPICLELEFQLLRPPSVSEKKRPYPTVKPDLGKLGRAVEDAMKGIALRDDAQIVVCSYSKRYRDESGVRIRMSKLEAS